VVETPKAPLGLTSSKVSMNNSITELVLIESRSARNSQISNVSDERALETLNKAKALVMAVWQGF
jgi:hypothetical protein